MTVIPIKTGEQVKQREKLRLVVIELLDRMVKALDAPPAAKDEKEERGKEVATFSDLKEAVNTAVGVYRLFNATGDLDEAGAALEAYSTEMKNGSSNSRRR